MSDAPPDFRALARRYLDLWQDQVSAMAADPVLADALARGISVVAERVSLFAQAATARESDSGKAAHGAAPPDSRSVPLPPGPAPIAGASDGARLDDDLVAGRIAALEERVAALEAELGRRRRGDKTAPRRRRT